MKRVVYNYIHTAQRSSHGASKELKALQEELQQCRQQMQREIHRAATLEQTVSQEKGNLEKLNGSCLECREIVPPQHSTSARRRRRR